MTDRTADIRALCRELLETEGDPAASPDPFRLAEQLGVRVRYFPLGELKGFYLILEGIPFIALHRDLPEPLQRIVCAHELGHHLLHRDLAEKSVFNEYEMYEMENRLEREANLFAACLLIPAEAVEAFRAPENRGRSVKEAARLAGTTEELFAIRLSMEGCDTGVLISRFPG